MAKFKVFCRKKIQDEQPAIHSLQEIVDNLSSELKELKKEQAQVSHSVEQLKSNKDEKTDRLVSYYLRLFN